MLNSRASEERCCPVSVFIIFTVAVENLERIGSRPESLF
jgi:hypothetical protein